MEGLVKLSVKTTSRNRIQPLGQLVENKEEQLSSTQMNTETETSSKKPSQNDSNVRDACLKAKNDDYQGAISQLNTIRPPTCESLYYRGCAHLEMGKLDAALTDFDEAIKLKQHAEYPRLYYKRAFVCHLLGRYVEAILDYSMFIEYAEKKDLHKGYLGRGLVYTDLIDSKNTLKDIQKANELSPKENVYYQYCLLRAQINLGREHDARSTLNKLETSLGDFASGGSFDGHFYCGVARYDLKEYPDAFKHFEKAFQDNPTKSQQGELHFYIGLIYHSRGQISEAKEKIKQTLNINENHGRSLFQLGLMNSEDQNSLPSSIEYLSHAHELFPHKSEILYERGEVYHRMGQLKASLNDKRRAMQMQQSDKNSLPDRNDFELLLNRLVSLSRSEKVLSENNTLVEAILHDKLSALARDQNNLSLSAKHYHQAISMYQNIIDPEKEDEFSVLAFALIFNLCNENQHPIPALTAIDQFNRILDEKHDLEMKFKEILQKIKDEAEKQKGVPLSENLAEISKALRKQRQSSLEENREMNRALLQLLTTLTIALEKIVDARDKIKRDLETFKDDANGNRVIFYQKMRVKLSHCFVAIAMTSGAGDNPIIRHDRTGTQFLIGQAINLVGKVIGGSLKTGGGLVSGIVGWFGGQIQENEHARYQDRMSIIASVGTIEEFNQVARQITRQLAERYKTQILCLVDPDQVKSSYRCLPCRVFRTKTAPLNTSNPRAKEKPATLQCSQVVQFAVEFLLQTILNEESEKIGLKDGMEAEDLAKCLLPVICRAKPDLKGKLFRRIQLEKDLVLFHTSINGRVHVEHVMNDWHLHEFYSKPAIRLLNVDGEPKNVSWSNAELYGDRGGTEEEYETLRKADQSEQEKRSRCPCKPSCINRLFS